jgi:NADH:ubiquinone oxidoreductase subunit
MWDGNCRLGNRYYEDMGELPLRERWVEYAESHEYDSTQIEPGWSFPSLVSGIDV